MASFRTIILYNHNAYWRKILSGVFSYSVKYISIFMTYQKCNWCWDYSADIGRELTTRILRIQKRVITSMVGVSTRTSCRQLFKELNVLTLVSLYIMEVTCYIRKHHQFVELNSNIHAHNTLRKMDIHIQSHNTDLYKRSAINVDTKLYNKLPGTQNKQTAIRPLRRNWNHFFFYIPFTQWKNL